MPKKKKQKTGYKAKLEAIRKGERGALSEVVGVAARPHQRDEDKPDWMIERDGDKGAPLSRKRPQITRTQFDPRTDFQPESFITAPYQFAGMSTSIFKIWVSNEYGLEDMVQIEIPKVVDPDIQRKAMYLTAEKQEDGTWTIKRHVAKMHEDTILEGLVLSSDDEMGEALMAWTERLTQSGLVQMSRVEYNDVLPKAQMISHMTRAMSTTHALLAPPSNDS